MVKKISILFFIALITSVAAPFYSFAADATLSWDANTESDLAGYSVYYGTTPGVYLQAKGEGINAGNNLTYSITNLNEGNTYYFTVTAYDQADNDSGYSLEVSENIPVPDTTPPVVSITSPINGSTVSGTITISANASDNVAVAGVQFKLDGANLGAEDTTSPYSITWDTTIAANSVHTLTAIARDNAGNSVTSSAVNITVNNILPDTQAPTTPTGLTVIAISSSQINLSWTASTDNVAVTGYKIYRCTGLGCAPTQLVNSQPANSLTYSDTGLTASTAYTYAVSAYDAAGNESVKSSSASATTPSQTGNTYYISPTGSDTTGNGSNTSPWATLSKAFGQMVGGDTLIIRDGSYKGISNAMNDAGSTVYPPNGSPGNYTIIRAENEGQVIFDGEGVRSMFYLVNSPQYLQFQGIKWINPSGDISVVLISRGNHIKIVRSGAGNNINNRGETQSFNIMRSSYILLEDVYAWGAGRYKFAFFLSDHIICRRCVARTDATTGIVGTTAAAVAVFQNYCSQYVEYQNSIAIDTDTPEYWTQYSELEGGFTSHPYCEPPADEYSENTDYRGSIALNVKQNSVLTFNTSRNFSFRDFVGWDTLTGFYPRTPVAPYNYNINHSLFGNMSTDDGIMDYSNNTVVTNSIIYKNNRYGLGGVANSNYNSLYFNKIDYFNTSPGPNDLSAANGNAINPITGTPGNGVPALKYLLRVEDGSNLDGAASDGGDIGPTILKKIGVSGTLYGEPGYNEVTNEDLWPFPYEDQIKSAFASYNPGGTDPTKPDGKRGFAAGGNDQFGKPLTLTRYIWQYLGNEIPPEIYGGGLLTITTTSLPSATVGSVYSQTLTASGGTAPYTWLISASSLPLGLTLNSASGVISGIPTTNGTYTFTVQVSDSSSPANIATKALFITVLSPDTAPPSTPAGLTATAISSAQIDLSWPASTDNVAVTGYKIYRCAGSTCTPTTQIGTSAINSYSDTGLAASTTYTYTVSAYDAAGNESNQSSPANATTLATSLTSGLVAHWKLDEGSGTTAQDSSGNANHGTLINGPTWTTGKIGGALSFDGVDDYVDVGDINIVDFMGSDSFSYGTWLRAKVIDNTGRRIISKRTGTSASAIGYDMSVWSGRNGLLVELSDGAIEKNNAVPISLNADQWHFVMNVIDRAVNELRIYVDGKLQTTLDISGLGSLGNGSALTFGQLSGGSQYNGIIDEIRIYNRGLSAEEIQELYNLGSGTPTYQCSDGIDNDGDGKIDYPLDPDCLLATDNNESDTTPPAGTVSINAGATYAKSTSATLTLSATDSGSGMGAGAQMQFSNDNTTWSTAEAYSTSKAWTLSAGDGLKTVYAKYKDVAGNWMTTAVSDTIILDATLPILSISAPTAGSAVSGASVIISADATDTNGIAGVQFKLDGANLGAEDTTSPYAITWDTTTTTNSAHTLIAIARDNAGNSATSSAVNITVNNILPDTQAPTTPTGLTVVAISSSQINLSWSASTDDVGVAGYKIYRDDILRGTIDEGGGTSYSDSGLQPSTTYTYAISAYDAAGNESLKSTSASATTQTQTGGIYYVDDDALNDSGDGSINNPKKYITSAIQLLNGGDTLIIKDGIYTGANNMIGDYASPRVYPPSGLGSNQYTVIKAENIGGAIIDGEYQRTAFSTQNRTAKVNYVHIEGIHFRRSSCGVFALKGDYNKVIRSGFEDGISPSSTNECEIASIAGGSSYSLVEDSWIWGRGRIGLYSSSIESGTNHIIFRRVVVRQDDSPPKWVSAGLLFYNADTNVCQNCVVIDSNTDPTSNNTGAFETARYAANTSWLGSIALNNNHYYGFYPQDTRQITTVKNTVFWGGAATGWEIMVNSQGTLNSDHTISGFNQGGSIRGNGFRSSNAYPTTENVTNSISVSNSGYGFSEVDNIDTVNVFGNTYGACNNCAIINAKTTNPFITAPGYSSPALKYLPRIEANSNLKGAATDGGDIGATILKKIGASGTLYGEPGWDQTTNEDLWPWPDEDIWTPKLRAYTASGPGGNRGFAADGTGLYGGPITLTSYIWEYLGNPCPVEICGSKGSPTITITQPTTSSTWSTKNSTVTLSGTATDNIAVSKVTWSNSRGGSGTAQGTTTWSIPDIPLQLGSNTITVTAEDTDGNTGTDAIIVTYDSELPSIPAILNATAISSSQIDLSWTASTDNIGVTGYKIFRNGSQIATSTTTSYSNTGLTAGTIYTYAVSAYDAAGNESAQSSPVSATTPPPDTIPPSTPASLTATAMSSSQIDLSWSASTDNVAVTGYKIYRCAGSTCTPTTQIGTSATNSYSDTGLTASTAYTYTVSAYDAAGNESNQSSPASATTLATSLTSGLIGHWKLDEGSGTTAQDSSGNANHGTLINGPTWTTGKIGGALSFDGVNDRIDTTNFGSFVIIVDIS